MIISAFFPGSGCLPAAALVSTLVAERGGGRRLLRRVSSICTLLDASPQALAVARQNLSFAKNVSYHANSVAEIPLPPNSLDFAYSIGVLHHVPNTQAAIKAIAKKLKPGAAFLSIFTTRFDNRPAWYRALWRSFRRSSSRHLASASSAAARRQFCCRYVYILAAGARRATSFSIWAFRRRLCRCLTISINRFM